MPRPRYGQGGVLASLYDTQDRLQELQQTPGSTLGSIAGLLSIPQRAEDDRAATLAAYEEMLAPQLSREEGIPEDAARQRISGGVKPIEPVYKAVGRWFGLGGDEPAGESYAVRMGRLRGMAARYGMADDQRKTAVSSLGELLDAAGKLEDPAALAPAIQNAARRAGLGDIGAMRFKPKVSSSVWEYAERHNMDPIALLGSINASRGGGRGQTVKGRPGRWVKDPNADALAQTIAMRDMAAWNTLADPSASDEDKAAARTRIAASKRLYATAYPDGGWKFMPSPLMGGGAPDVGGDGGDDDPSGDDFLDSLGVP